MAITPITLLREVEHIIEKDFRPGSCCNRTLPPGDIWLLALLENYQSQSKTLCEVTLKSPVPSLSLDLHRDWMGNRKLRGDFGPS